MIAVFRQEPTAVYNRVTISTKQSGTTIARRDRARSRFSNWPPQSSQTPAGSRTFDAIRACASCTTPAMSRPRTFACTTTRRFPFSRLIWFGPLAVTSDATEPN
jgi:hypothetical protein